MTKQEFDNTGWTCGMTAEYAGHTYNIAACDFEERLVGLLSCGSRIAGDDIKWVRCESVKVNQPNPSHQPHRTSCGVGLDGVVRLGNQKEE